MGSTASQVIQTLTNYARGIAQDRMGAVANKLAPIVRVGTSVGKYKTFNDTQNFQVPDTSRPIGGAARRIDFLASDGDYACKPNALSIAIDDEEVNSAGGDLLGLQQAKIAVLVDQALAAHENRVLTAVKADVSAAATKTWSGSSDDPVLNIDEQIKTIATATGRMPNRIVMGLGAWYYARNSVKTIARQPGAANIGVTTAQFAAMLLNPAIEITVGTLSKDTVKTGGTSSKANIVGDEVFIFYGSDAPNQYDPSFAKTFSVGSGGVESVRMFRSEVEHSDVYEVFWSSDVKVVSTLTCKRLTIN